MYVCALCCNIHKRIVNHMIIYYIPKSITYYTMNNAFDTVNKRKKIFVIKWIHRCKNGSMVSTFECSKINTLRSVFQYFFSFTSLKLLNWHFKIYRAICDFHFGFVCSMWFLLCFRCKKFFFFPIFIWSSTIQTIRYHIKYPHDIHQ